MLIAAKLIGEIAGIHRFTSDAQLARLAGCATLSRRFVRMKARLLITEAEHEVESNSRFYMSY